MPEPAPAPVEDGPAGSDTPIEGVLGLFRAIVDYLAQVADALERIEPPPPTSKGAAPTHIDVSLKLKLFASIVVSVSETETQSADAEPAERLLGSLIDSIAEQAEHLDARA